MMPLSMPIASFSTLAKGDRQFVVQDPFDTIRSLDYETRWLTP